MPNVLEDLRRVFPKKSFLFKTYMLGCLYLCHKQINVDERKKRLAPTIFIRQFYIQTHHLIHLKQFQQNLINDSQLRISRQQKQSYGLMEFRTPKITEFPDFTITGTASQVHALQIDSKQVHNFSLDDLSTIESEFIPDIKTDIQRTVPIEMTQSCIF